MSGDPRPMPHVHSCSTRLQGHPVHRPRSGTVRRVRPRHARRRGSRGTRPHPGCHRLGTPGIDGDRGYAADTGRWCRRTHGEHRPPALSPSPRSSRSSSSLTGITWMCRWHSSLPLQRRWSFGMRGRGKPTGPAPAGRGHRHRLCGPGCPSGVPAAVRLDRLSRPHGRRRPGSTHSRRPPGPDPGPASHCGGHARGGGCCMVRSPITWRLA